MSFLSLNCDKILIYVLIYWILDITFSLLIRLHPEFFQLIEQDAQTEYLLVILSCIGDLLAGFLVLYIRKKSKRKKIKTEEDDENKDTDENKNYELIYEKAELKPKKYYWIKIIIIGVLEYIGRSLDWINYSIFSYIDFDINKVSHFLEKNMINIIDIIFRYILSIFILRLTIYKHGKLSIIMISIGLIILLVTDLFLINYTNRKKSITSTIYYSMLSLIRGISFPFEDIIIKKLFLEDNIFPETLQFLRGIIVLIIIIILTPILYFSFGLTTVFNPSYEVIITLICFTLHRFIKAYIILKIIYRFSSQSISFLLISGSLASAIKRITSLSEKTDISSINILLIVLESIGVFIVLLAAFIYDEIIIINKWGLNKNVRNNIYIRGISEMESIDNLKDLHYQPVMTGILNPEN